MPDPALLACALGGVLLIVGLVYAFIKGSLLK